MRSVGLATLVLAAALVAAVSALPQPTIQPTILPSPAAVDDPPTVVNQESDTVETVEMSLLRGGLSFGGFTAGKTRREAPVEELIQGWRSPPARSTRYDTADGLKKIVQRAVPMHRVFPAGFPSKGEDNTTTLPASRILERWLEGVLVIFAVGVLASFIHSRFNHESSARKAVPDSPLSPKQWGGWLAIPGAIPGPVVHCGYCRTMYSACSCGADLGSTGVADEADQVFGTHLKNNRVRRSHELGKP